MTGVQTCALPFYQADIAPQLYARINAHDLKRIVSNLIENARRYGRTPADDRAHIQLSARQEGSIIAIEVQDNGTGIAPTDIQRLLRPFSRGESARTGVSGDRKSVVSGKRVSERVDTGGGRNIKKKKKK